MTTLTRSSFDSDRPVRMLLRVNFSGRVLLWSSSPCDPVDADGEAQAHTGGLPESAFERVWEPFTDAPDLPSLRFDLHFPGDVDLALLEARNTPLEGSTGEVSLWREGDAYESRLVLLEGDVANVSYGDASQPVSFVLERRALDDRALVPPFAARVAPETWSTHRLVDRYKAYPLVYGAPGTYQDPEDKAATRETTATPALQVGFSAPNVTKLLIAGHVVRANQVTIWDGDGTNQTMTVTEEADSLGRTVSTVDMTSGTGSLDLTSDEWWVTWPEDGALPNADNTGPMTGGGELVRYLLGLSTIPVDKGRVAAVEPVLNRYKFAGYIDDPASPYSIVTDRLLKWMPAALYSGPDGIYPIAWDYWATTADAVAHLEDGLNVDREGRRVQQDRDTSSRFNAVRLEWAPQMRQGGTRRVTYLTPTPDPDDPDQIGSYIARLSYRRLGQVLEQSFTAEDIYDAATASQVVNWMVRATALGAKTIAYTGGLEFATLEPGAVVTLTDSGLHLTNQVALVRSNRIMGEQVEIGLLIIPDPARDSIP